MSRPFLFARNSVVAYATVSSSFVAALAGSEAIAAALNPLAMRQVGSVSSQANTGTAAMAAHTEN
jgi:hypothetical protein